MTWCVGSKHESKTNKIIEHENLNPKTKKLVKTIKRAGSICVPYKSQVFTK